MRDGFAVDKWLLLAVAALAALGVTMVLSTSYLYAQERFGDGTYFLRKQLLAMGAGLAALIVCSLVPATTYRRLAYPMLAVTFVVLILVLIPGIGVSRGGARRWLMLPGFAFQPAELAKLALVLYLAHSMPKKAEKIKTFSLGVLPHLIVGGVFLIALLLQPDFGTALILAALLHLLLFFGGVRVSHLLALGFMALPLLVYVMLTAEYRLRRLLTFMDPWRDASSSGFQVVQSLIA